jgi:enoyl-CoA hydratase/carnithine racemase
MSVDLEMRGAVAVVTLNDPDRRNALSRRLVRDLNDGLDEARRQGARATVLAARGKAFCAGADIADLLEAGWMEGRSEGPDPVDVFERLAGDDRVTVAAVTGPALGGGFELTLCCDFVVASREASFATPEVGHGVIPNTGLARLAAILGTRRAMELALTGRKMSTEEALSLGLVNAIAPARTVVEAAVALAADIVAAASPGAIAATKESLRRHHATDWAEVRASLARIAPEEWREGLGAFLAKRRPDYDRFWTRP